jgi:hypothetical protein
MTKFHLRLAVVGLSMCFFLLEGPSEKKSGFTNRRARID